MSTRSSAGRALRVAGWVAVVLGALLVLAGFAAAFSTVGAILLAVGLVLAVVGLPLAAGSLWRLIELVVYLIGAMIVALFVMAGIGKLINE